MSVTPEQLTLYYSPYCPYCHRVLNALLELGYPADLKNADANGIALKNTFSDCSAAKELKDGGGKSTVPCLQINRDDNNEWLYESLDIVAFLQANLLPH